MMNIIKLHWIESLTAELASKLKEIDENEIEHQLLIFFPFCNRNTDKPVSEKSIEFTTLYKSQLENCNKHECNKMIFYIMANVLTI